MMSTHDNPIILQCPIDGHNNVLTVFTNLCCERLSLDFVAHGFQFIGNPIASIDVLRRVNLAITKICH